MSQALAIGAAGLEAQQRALDAAANNIANINTTGFKRADVQFSQMIMSASDPDNPPTDLTGDASLAGVSAHTVLALDAQGDITQTGNSLDLAIDGRGFVPLLGAHGQELLWRGGTLHIANGALVTEDGVPLAAGLSVPANATAIEIDADGQVIAHASAGDAGNVIGRIGLVEVDDPNAVEPLDGGVLRVLDESGLSEATAGENGAGTFVQGALERSNVDLSSEMISLIVVQRAYAANAQMLSAADQLMGIANNLRR
jgi:flagellar basal-body rod protein FlgG